MKIEEASDERDRSAVVSGQIHSAAASNPFRSEDGGGRRVKPRHSIQVKNSSKQSTFDSHDAKKRRSSSVHGEIQGDGVRTSTSPACRDTSNPDPHAQAAGDVDVQSGGAGILQWEPSEHDGLLSAQDGRKRWFRCTKCDYYNDRLYHSKMHYERIHVNNGKSMPRKRKYTKQSPAGTPINAPSPSLLGKFQPAVKDKHRTITPSQGGRDSKTARLAAKSTPTNAEKVPSPSPPSLLTSSPAISKSSAVLCRPSAVVGEKGSKSVPSMRGGIMKNNTITKLFTAARSRILTFGDGSFSPRSGHGHIGSGLSFSIKDLRAPEDIEEDVKPEPPPKPKPSSLVPGEIRQLGSGVTTISPGKCVARIRADQQQTTSLQFDERGFSSLSSSREASARACASPKPNVKSEHIEGFTSPLRHSNFLRPRSALVTPTRSAVSRRAIMRAGSPTSPLGGSANRTAMTMGLSLNSMEGRSRNPVGEVEARLICDESLGVACAFDDLDNDMEDFSQSSSDILAWNPETNSSAYK